MLDKLCKKFLRTLINYCGDNGYSIIEIAELVSVVSNKLDQELLKKYINYLTDNEYIDVKYFDDKQICLAILPKARVQEEEAKEVRKLNHKYLRLSVLMAVASLVTTPLSHV